MKEVYFMNPDFFQLLYHYLEERPYNNVYENLQQDAEYLKADELVQELSDQYEQLNLTSEQQKLIKRWADAIQAKEEAYNVVVFRMGLQYAFSIFLQLVNINK